MARRQSLTESEKPALSFSERKDWVPNSARPAIGFASVYGKNVEIIKHGKQAKRKGFLDSQVTGLCFVNQIYQIDEMVIVKIKKKSDQAQLVRVWDTNNYFGFTNQNPDKFQKQLLPMHKEFYSFAQNREDFIVFQLSAEILEEGSIIKFWLTDSGILNCELPRAKFKYLRGPADKSFGSIRINKPFWPVIDISGSFESVEILPKRLQLTCMIKIGL